jgi:hypothetical protein
MMPLPELLDSSPRAPGDFGTTAKHFPRSVRAGAYFESPRVSIPVERIMLYGFLKSRYGKNTFLASLICPMKHVMISVCCAAPAGPAWMCACSAAAFL